MSQEPGASGPIGRARRTKRRTMTPYEDKGIPRRAVIYVRVSQEEQAEGHSLEAQERECREFIARTKPHWTIVGVFRDTHSGKTTDRPGFRKMMDLSYDGGGRMLSLPIA